MIGTILLLGGCDWVSGLWGDEQAVPAPVNYSETDEHAKVSQSCNKTCNDALQDADHLPWEDCYNQCVSTRGFPTK